MFMLVLFSQQAFSQVQTARYISITPNTNAFYEYLPQGYSATSTQKYPFILFLHGSGEEGDGSPTSLPLVLRNGPPKLISQGTFPTSFTVNGQTFRFIVLSPQFINWPTSADVDAVISYAISHYNVDPSRVYITGLSMGGGATWEYAGDENNAAYPKRVAAISPIAGASYPSTYRAQIISSNNIAVWAFHNDGDPTAPSWYTIDYVNYINATVPPPTIPAKATIFSSTSHDAWTKAYDPNYRENGMNVYEWMLQYARGSVPPTNTPPTVNAGVDQTITLPANSVQLSGTASDPGGSIASYAWTKISGPSQFTFSSTSIANPSVSNLAQGTYTFRLTVTDNQGATAYDDVNIIVNATTSTGTKYVKVNIYGGTNSYADVQWNNWNTYSSLSSGSLKYSDGTSSSISAALSQQNGVSDNGPSYAASMAPSGVVRYASYSSSNRALTISGLDNSKTYNLEIYASRSGTSNNTTRFAIGATSIDILTDNNLSNKASFASLVPSSGTITVSISKLNNYNYINGWMLTENGSGTTTNTPPTVNAGVDQTITLPTSSVQLSGTASDVDGSIASYSWTKISGPSQFTFSSTSVVNPSVSNLAQGTYTFRLTVTDNQGATAYDDVNIVVNGAVSTPAKNVRVNIYGGANPYSNTAWNNWNTFSSLSSGNLKYDDGSASSINMSLSQQNSVSDNGTSFSATVAPNEVIRYASYSTSNRTLTISGLDNTKTYNLELYASRMGATNNTTRFTIGVISVDILTDNNLSNKASFASLVPSNGQITVSISKLNSYNYINGVTLTENASGTVAAASKSQVDVTTLSSTFNLYPNPVEDRFVLQMNNSNTGKMKVQVIDINGVTQKEFSLSKNQTGALQTYLSIGDLKAGEYIIRVQIGEWVETKKISKL